MNPNLENYKVFLDVFKGYLDTALTANIWFYAFTGAIVTYYLSNRNKRNEEKTYLKYSLFIPFILGVQIICLSILGVGQARFIASKMLELAGNKELENIPAAEILINFLKASIGLVSLICIGLILLFMFLEEFPLRPKIMDKMKTKWLRVISITSVALVIVAYYTWIYACL